MVYNQLFITPKVTLEESLNTSNESLETLRWICTHCPCVSPNVHDKHSILTVPFCLNGKLILLWIKSHLYCIKSQSMLLCWQYRSLLYSLREERGEMWKRKKMCQARTKWCGYRLERRLRLKSNWISWGVKRWNSSLNSSYQCLTLNNCIIC